MNIFSKQQQLFNIYSSYIESFTNVKLDFSNLLEASLLMSLIKK